MKNKNLCIGILWRASLCYFYFSIIIPLYALTPQEVIEMKKAGVSDETIQKMIDNKSNPHSEFTKVEIEKPVRVEVEKVSQHFEIHYQGEEIKLGLPKGADYFRFTGDSVKNGKKISEMASNFSFKYYVFSDVALGLEYSMLKTNVSGKTEGPYSFSGINAYGQYFEIDRTRFLDRRAVIIVNSIDLVAYKYDKESYDPEKDKGRIYIGASIGVVNADISEKSTLRYRDNISYQEFIIESANDLGGNISGMRFQIIIGGDYLIGPLFIGMQCKYATPVSGKWESLGWDYNPPSSSTSYYNLDSDIKGGRKSVKVEVGGLLWGLRIGVKF